MTIIRPTTINARFSQPVGLGGEKLWLCPTLGGDRLDLSGNGNHGTYNGGMGTVADKYKGGARAYSFDGSNDVVRVSNDLTLANDITIAAHAKSFDPNALAIVAGNLLEASPYPQNYILYQYLGSWRANVKFSGSSWTTVIGPPVVSGQWVHLTLVRSTARSDIRLYVDGSLYGTTASSGTVVTIPQMYFAVGARPISASTQDAFFDGSCDDIRLFQRVLTPSEIKHLASKRGVLGSPRQPYDPLKRTVVRVPAAIPAATKVGSIKKPTTIIKPSYQSGYARNASESENPQLWDGLVGAWMPSLGVTGETLRDVSGRENHADYTTAYGEKANWEVGNLRSGSWNVSHSLSTRVWLTSGGDDLSTTSATASFWVYVRSLRAGIESGFISKKADPLGSDVATNVNFHVNVSSGYLLARFSSATNVNHVLIGDQSTYGGSNTAFPLNQWLHIAATYDENSGTAKLYRNAKNVVTVNGSPAPLKTGDGYTMINAVNNTGRFYLDGLMNSMLVHNRALSPTEIKQLYVDSLAPFRKKQRVSVAVPAAVPTPSATYHPLRSLAHPLEQ